MKENCVFCRIVKGELPSSKIYEDDDFLAILSIAPINKGHTLILTKEHHEQLLDVPEKILGEYMVIVRKVAEAVKKATKCDAFNIGMNNGKEAGQEIFHSHIHIIPRNKDDGYKNWGHKDYENKEMEKYAELIRKELK